MAEPNIENSFMIDAAKLLAKLHRGACETHKDMKFFNSGVVNDEDIAPDACEKSKITFDTGVKQYELGVVVKDEIQCKLKHTADDILDKMTEAKKEEDEKSGISEKPVSESDIPSFMQFVREDDKKPESKPGEVYVDPFNEPKDASDEVKKMVKENQDELEKTVQDTIKNSVQYLQHYMKVFAGESESKKITEKSVARVYLPDGAKPAGFKYENGVIEGVSDEDRKKEWDEALKAKPDIDVYVIKNLCCKIAYTLNMES